MTSRFVEEGVAPWLRSLPRRVVVGVMLAGAALITSMSVDYFDLETLPPFVVEKLPVRFEALWLGSLRVHVASALLSFPLCLLLATRTLQKRAVWHRWIGRIAASVVLFGSNTSVTIPAPNSGRITRSPGDVSSTCSIISRM